jgi:glucokinase
MRAEAGLAVVGVDLGGTKCHAVLADAAGRVLHEDYRRTASCPDPADVVVAGLTALRRAATEEGLRVAAVAVGVPGFVDPRTGLVVGANNLTWGDSYDLGARLGRELPVPFLVENDVNLAALGEARAGAGRGAASFVTVSLGTGLGGAVVVDGTVLRGAHSAAGELGFLLAGRHQLRRPGLMGMESLVAGPALAARARELAADDASSPLAGGVADAAAVFAAAAQGDPVGERVVGELLEHLAMAVVDVCAVVDPERVVLDGSVGRSLAPYLTRLAELVRPALLYPPELRISELAPNAALAGAVSEALRLAAGAR